MKGAECDAEYLQENVDKYQSAKALLLDAHAPGMAGGTGETFDWTTICDIEKPMILAGGLTADNVKHAIKVATPFAVDVSSGVESAPGIKDEEKVQRFMEDKLLEINFEKTKIMCMGGKDEVYGKLTVVDKDNK